MLPRLCLLSALAFTLIGCESIAISTTPQKKPAISSTQTAKVAENTFWKTLHSGRYEDLPNATRLMTAAYLETPTDPTLAAHLGFLHIWKITERARYQPVDPTITDHIILARKFFADAVQLNPNDARFQGFLGDSMLAEASIFHDDREQVQAYFQLKRSIHQWPEFNYFTAGYPMSTLDPSSDHFQEALAWQWKTLDLCAGAKIDRNNPDYRPYMSRETQIGPQRACWNSWIAPHNFEGFFLNMGDMLVKSGNWQTGIKIYKTAKLSKQYQSWPYRTLLESRIANAEGNVEKFRHEKLDKRAVLFNSGYGCVACHQA